MKEARDLVRDMAEGLYKSIHSPKEVFRKAISNRPMDYVSIVYMCCVCVCMCVHVYVSSLCMHVCLFVQCADLFISYYIYGVVEVCLCQ